MAEPSRYRTIWISDLHLGTRDAKADIVLDFLKSSESEHLYLVGDVIDGWALARTWYWDQAHNDVVQKLLRKARKGTRVVYIPGNHDDFARGFVDHDFGGIAVRQSAVHTTADGRQLLVLHGDEFDGIVRNAEWLSKLGAWAYVGVLGANRHLNRARYGLGLPYWSLAAYLKGKAKRAVQYVASFGEAVAAEARRCDVDGVVCGHIHSAEIRRIGGIEYLNCGDWVESCTALVEHLDGRLELVRWHDVGHAPRGPAAERARDRAPVPLPFPLLPGDGVPGGVEVRVPKGR